MRHRPLGEYKWISLSAAISLFIAFLLFLLVAVSLPLIDGIYLFIIDFKPQANQPPTSIATDLRFGVWGFCASSVLDLPTIFDNNGRCTKPRLGYDVPEDLLDLTGYPDAAGLVVKAFTVLFVLHPVCAIVAFACMFTSLFLSSKAMTIISLFLSTVSALLGSIVFAIDLAIEIVARDKVAPVILDGNVMIGWGNGPWMMVVAVFFTWVSVALLSAVACRYCGPRKWEVEKMRARGIMSATTTTSGAPAQVREIPVVVEEKPEKMRDTKNILETA